MLFAVALVATALAGTTQAPTGQGNQGNQAGGQTPTPDKRISVDAQGNVRFAMDERTGIPIQQFIKFAQGIIHKSIVIDPNDPIFTSADSPMGKLQMMGTMVVKKEDFYSFFQAMLYIKNLVCVPRRSGSSEFIEIINKSAGTRTEEIKKGVIFVPLEEVANYRDQTGTYIVTTMTLKYVDAMQASGQIRVFTQDAQNLTNLTSIGGSRALMITGFGPMVYVLTRVLSLIDVKQEMPKATLRVIPLAYSSVEDVEPVLNELLNNARTPAAQPAQGQRPAPEDLVPTKIIANTNNNTLIVHAHEDKILEIEDMVAKLDTKYDEIEGNYHIYHLKNTQAKDMRQTLSDFLRQTDTAQQRTQGARTTPGAATSGSREQQVVIIDDENSNSLLISATRNQYEKIKEMVEKLDVKQPQVLIETAVIELGTQDVERLGVELGLLDLGGDKFTRPFAFTSFGLTQFQDTDGNGLPDTRLPDIENPLQGVTGGIISSSDFAIPVVLNALQSNTSANVLSIPSVLVNNNGEAVVESREDVPVSQSNQGTVTTQTSFGGFQGAGIQLKISPSISERSHLAGGSYVRLGLELTVSNFTSNFDPNAALPPPKTTRIITTQVTMPSGHTMVLGGVIEDQAGKNEDKIPFLGDLPLIGALFRRHESTNKKTNLYFFVTPHILQEDDFSDLAELTFRKKLEAARYIGHRRIKLIDRKWTGQDQVKLEDEASTIEDLDKMGGFEIPTYERAPGGEGKSSETIPGLKVPLPNRTGQTQPGRGEKK